MPITTIARPDFSQLFGPSFTTKNEPEPELREMNESSAPLFIFLEGVDRSGKDSMQDAIDKATKYKHIVTDRGPIGFKSYCDIYDKPKSLYNKYHQMEKDLLHLPNVLVIYITADTETLVDRCIRTQHEVLDFDYHKLCYGLNVDGSPLRTITVDTTHRHVTEIVQDLISEGVL